MTLSLRVVNMEVLPNGGPLEVRLDRHGLIVGRAPTSDWHLPDPRSFISSVHCEIDYRDGAYWLIDRSRNGTFLAGSSESLGERPHRIQSGDRFLVGHYEIEARAAAQGHGAAMAAPAAPAAGPGQLGPAPDWGGWGGAAAPPAPIASPDRWDAPPPQPVISGQGPMNQSWAPPAVSAPPPPQQGFDAWSPPPPPPPPVSGWSSAPDPYAQAQDAPARDVWGELEGSAAVDWAAGGFGRRQEPERAAWDQPAPSPPASDPFGLSGPPAADPFGLDAQARGAPPPPGPYAAPGRDPFAPAPQTFPPDAGPAGFAAPPQRPAYGSQPGVDPFGMPSAAPQAQPGYPGAPPQQLHQPHRPAPPQGGMGLPPPEPSRPRPGPAPASVGPADASAAQAFLAGAGINPAGLKTNPAAALETGGALLRRLVAGLSIMLEARARAKAQLGAQNTMFEFRGNNPLKFARTPEQALLQLINPPERGFMEPERAVEDAFKDLQAHQMATLSAMQGALRATLARFSPQAIRDRAEKRGILSKILPNAREAAMWQAYEKEFEGVARGSDEAFMDVFAKEFKAAYEKAARANAKQQSE
jgi:type VI secretion system FHA domain protein